MRRYLSLLVLVIASVAGSANAQEPATVVANPCEGETQYEMNVCAAEDLARAEKRLAALIKALEKKLSPGEFKGLRSVQALWIKYRNSHCDWDASFAEGGSISPLLRMGCKETLTRTRISELKAFLCDGATMEAPCEASRKFD